MKSASTWVELEPEQGVVEALDHAGVRPSSGQDEKRGWSERFADGCAVAIARQFAKHPELARKSVRPQSLAGGTEPLTPLGAGQSKRIDVTVVDAVLGLELGVSLKGLNFRDSKSNNFDKNLTGRLYELGDEVRVVHEHLPHAFMVGVFFLPLESCDDKGGSRAPSSFANAVLKLRARTGRLDPALAAHYAKCDAAFVGLYAAEAGIYARGSIRFFNVQSSPPRRGRPKISSTLSLGEMVDLVVQTATQTSSEDWAEAEE